MMPRALNASASCFHCSSEKSAPSGLWQQACTMMLSPRSTFAKPAMSESISMRCSAMLKNGTSIGSRRAARTIDGWLGQHGAGSSTRFAPLSRSRSQPKRSAPVPPTAWIETNSRDISPNASWPTSFRKSTSPCWPTYVFVFWLASSSASASLTARITGVLPVASL